MISFVRFFQARVLLAVWWAWPLLASAEVSATAPLGHTVADPQKQQVRGFLLHEPHRAKLSKKEQALKKTPDVIDCLVQCLVDAPNSFFIFTDHLGTPFAWVNAATGEITYTPYSPWGELLAQDPTRGPPAFPEGNIPASGVALPEFSGFPGKLPPLGLAGHLIEQDTGLVVMHHRTYHPRLGHFLTPDFRPPSIDDPSTFTEPYAYANGSPLMYYDPNGLIGIFFDGTWNDKEAMENPTNVAILESLYQGATIYRRGPGTKPYHYVLGKGNKVEDKIEELLGGLSGWRGKERLRDAYIELVKIYNAEYQKFLRGEKADLEIDIFGFSRGSAMSREFANMLDKYGIPLITDDGTTNFKPNIRFMGIFDTVGSFGIPGNSLNIGYDLTTPDNVRYVRHATANDEFRSTFPLSSVLVDPEHPGSSEQILGHDRFVEKGFIGAHSDVGGGYDDEKSDYLAKIPLQWMHQNAVSLGVPLGPISAYDSVVPPSNMRPFFVHDSMKANTYLFDQIRHRIKRKLGISTDDRKVYYSNKVSTLDKVLGNTRTARKDIIYSNEALLGYLMWIEMNK